MNMSKALQEKKDRDAKIDFIYNQLRDETVKRIKKKEFKIPGGIRSKAKRGVKDNKILCVFLRNNKTLEFKLVKIFDGLIEVDKYLFNAYESDAIYTYKKLPVVVILEWRIIPVGGETDAIIQNNKPSLKAKIMGGLDDAENADLLNIKSFGQQTIIRAIERATLEDLNKKKKGFGIIWWILIAGVLIYIVGKALGFV